MRLIISLLSFLIVFILYFYIYEKNFNKKKDQEVLEIRQDKIELQNKLTDLTSLSTRISKKNIYLDLGQFNTNEIEISEINGPAFKKVNNFEESFVDIIPGDILNINLFGNIFQEEIKSVEKSSKNKIVKTYSQAEENESFVVIGEEFAFGKFHINEKVFLLKKDSKMTYLVNTAEADLVIPQFSEEDYSTRQE
ncbi:MAG: hypothetical protein CMQ76_02050 [Gammaproteobacteria bacterium]|nr:hypothetical protein [Gammaproteobacteria bacterium]